MNCTELATTFVYDSRQGLLSTEAKDVAGGTENDRFTEYKYGDSNEKTQQTKKTVKLYTDGSGGTLEQTAYGYNLQGRMSTVTIDSNGDGTPETQLAYEYNDKGIRTAQTKTTDGNADGDFVDPEDTSERTDYLIDEHNPTGYAQVLEESINGTLAKTYTIGHDVFAEAAAAGIVRRLLKDGHGSTRLLVDAGGAIVVNDMGTPGETSDDVAQVFRYDAYGNAIGFEQSAALTTLLYSGEQTDAATGLQYLRARYYDPVTGRFNRLDSFFGNIDDPISLHKYLYAAACPTFYVDASGLEFTILGFNVSQAIMSGLRKIQWGKVWLAYDYGSDFYDATLLVYRALATGILDPTGTALLLATLLPFDDVFKAIRHVKWFDEVVECGGKLVRKTGDTFNDALNKVYKGLDSVPVNQRHELIGELGGDMVATAQKLQPTGFVKRTHGIDNIYKDGDKWVILEAKGMKDFKLGSTTNKGKQMSKEWIEKSLEEAAKAGDTVAKEALDAIQKAPHLVEGMVVNTKVVDGVVQHTKYQRMAYDLIDVEPWKL